MTTDKHNEVKGENAFGYEAAYQSELQHFDELRPETEALDPHALTAARLTIRPEKEQAAFDEIRKTFPGKPPVFARPDTIQRVDRDLNEEGLDVWLRREKIHHSVEQTQ